MLLLASAVASLSMERQFLIGQERLKEAPARQRRVEERQKIIEEATKRATTRMKVEMQNKDTDERLEARND